MMQMIKMLDEAFVLINCKPGKEPSVLHQLKEMKNVVDAQGIFGVYDIIAKIESDAQSHLDDIITNQIRKLNEVHATLTLIPTNQEDELSNLIPDIIPDIIPEQKKPLDEVGSDNEEDEALEEDFDE